MLASFIHSFISRGINGKDSVQVAFKIQIVVIIIAVSSFQRVVVYGRPNRYAWYMMEYFSPIDRLILEVRASSPNSSPLLADSP